MSSKFDFAARVRSEGKITIPSELRSELNIEQGDIIRVSVHKPEWYELLDWSQMSSSTVNFNALPLNAQTYISTNYSCDSGGNSWRKQDV